MIHVDTSVLIAALTGPRALGPTLRARVAEGARLSLSTIALYEWLRGPRTAAELDMQQAFVPSWEAIEFGLEEAQVAARLYREVGRARSREIDLAIAACAITHEAELWTLNPEDFSDLPGLQLLGR